MGFNEESVIRVQNFVLNILAYLSAPIFCASSDNNYTKIRNVVKF